MQDFTLYRAFYCGICKTLGSMFGQFPRFTTNYDMTFLSVLLNDFMSQDVEILNEGCVLNPFKKKTIIARSQLLEKVSALNIILTYHKAKDDVIDEGGLKKRTVRRALKKPYKKAVKLLKEADEIADMRYKALLEHERRLTDGIDIVSDCFASLMRDVVNLILGEQRNENMSALSYNIGKFVYLIDALDDIDEDYKKKRYNPLLIHFNNYINRRQFIETNNKELEFMFAVTVNRVIECFNLLKPNFTQSLDLMTNIVHIGLRKKVEEIFSSDKKLKNPRI